MTKRYGMDSEHWRGVREREEERKRAEAAAYQQRLAEDRVGIEPFALWGGLLTEDPEAGFAAKYLAPTDVVPVGTGVKLAAGAASAALAAYLAKRAWNQPVQPGMLSSTFFHGTPHTWAPEPGFPQGRPRLGERRGQGAAMEGKGVYFGEARGTGEWYHSELASEAKGTISSDRGTMDIPGWLAEWLSDPTAHSMGQGARSGMEYRRLYETREAKSQPASTRNVWAVMEELRLRIEDTINRIKFPRNEFDVSYKPELQKRLIKQQKMLDDFKNIIGNPDEPLEYSVQKTGGVYTVDIPDSEVAGLLDLDKSIAVKTPYVQAKLNKILAEYDPKSPLGWGAAGERGEWSIEMYRGGGELPFKPEDITARTYYKALRLLLGDDEAARILENVGIPGIKYLDEKSRRLVPNPAIESRERTYNAVVFSEDLLKRIKVLKRE